MTAACCPQRHRDSGWVARPGSLCESAHELCWSAGRRVPVCSALGDLITR